MENRREVIYPDAAAELADLRALHAELEARWLDPVQVARHLTELLQTQALAGRNGSHPWSEI